MVADEYRFVDKHCVPELAATDRVEDTHQGANYVDEDRRGVLSHILHLRYAAGDVKEEQKGDEDAQPDEEEDYAEGRPEGEESYDP